LRKGTIIKTDISTIAIGGFDGMHLAHQQLFKYLPKKTGAIVVIKTNFESLTPSYFRKHYTALPIYLFALDKIKHLSPKDFIALLYKKFPNLKKIIVGYDFHFGYQAQANSLKLKELFKGEVIIVKEFSINNTPVHSTLIRKYLQNGDITLANKFLGHIYMIKGKHIKGQGLGKKEFVPTINISVKKFLLPQEGVYLTKTIINNIEYNSISFLGYRETTDNKYAIETHILDSFTISTFNNVYIKFYQKIRGNKKFDNFTILKQQISNDIKTALILHSKQ